MKTIALEENCYERGLKAIVSSGTVVWTAKRHVYHVPDETVSTLKAKRIPFTIVNQNGNGKKP